VRAIREHPEADVRRAAIDAYLYNHGDGEEAVRYVRTIARPEDQKWVGIPRRTLDTDPDDMRKRVDALTDRPPTPTHVRQPPPPAQKNAGRDHVSAKEPEF
jgi:hypothetical protein